MRRLIRRVLDVIRTKSRYGWRATSLPLVEVKPAEFLGHVEVKRTPNGLMGNYPYRSPDDSKPRLKFPSTD